MPYSNIHRRIIAGAALGIISCHWGQSWAEAPQKPVAAQSGSLHIVAVAGNHAISSFDVDSRLKFIFATTNISRTADMVANIRPQVIRSLIDESLEIQEAAKNNIQIDDKEVAQAIGAIEEQRGMPPGGISAILKEHSVPEKTLTDQVRAQLAWGRLLSKTVRPRIKISDSEIALAQGRISIPAVKNNIKEMEISVINLPVEKPKDEKEIKGLSDKLWGELNKGARFEEIARQFSASSDGKPFWIRPEQLDPAVAGVLKATAEGAVTQPIRTANGYSIIKLLHIRASKDNTPEMEVTLKEILLKLKPAASSKEADVLLQIAEEVAKNPGSCQEKGVASISDPDNFDIEVNFRKAPMSELPPALRSISDSLKLGDISTPFASAEGIRLYMLCDKKDITNQPVNADKVREILFKQKFELEAQKYLRNLRRETFIEIRG
jgi:peptidyl-prolyl cis-trans isomerase SurA